MITDSVTAEVEMSLTTTAGTPVTQAAVGDTLWLNIFLTDDFKDGLYFMYVKLVELRRYHYCIDISWQFCDELMVSSHIHVSWYLYNVLFIYKKAFNHCHTLGWF